jgi:ABC-type nitrate/sulfonate/bicarbonate transport system ATPase subunit
MNESIKFTNLNFAYQNGSETIPIYSNFNGLLLNNSISVILGRSATGKSTLLKLICGILFPFNYKADENQILICDLTPEKAREKKLVAYLPQFFHPALWLTVEKNVALALRFCGIKSERRHIEASQILKDLKLFDIQNCKASTLSGGQKRKVALAMLIATDATFILLDEPFSNLDTHSRLDIYNFLLNTWKHVIHNDSGSDGRALCIVTHDIEEAVLLGDKIFILDQKLPQNEFLSFDNPLNPLRNSNNVDDLRYLPEFRKFTEVIKKSLIN